MPPKAHVASVSNTALQGDLTELSPTTTVDRADHDRGSSPTRDRKARGKRRATRDREAKRQSALLSLSQMLRNSHRPRPWIAPTTTVEPHQPATARQEASGGQPATARQEALCVCFRGSTANTRERGALSRDREGLASRRDRDRDRGAMWRATLSSMHVASQACKAKSVRVVFPNLAAVRELGRSKSCRETRLTRPAAGRRPTPGASARRAQGFCIKPAMMVERWNNRKSRPSPTNAGDNQVPTPWRAIANRNPRRRTWGNGYKPAAARLE